MADERRITVGEIADQFRKDTELLIQLLRQAYVFKLRRAQGEALNQSDDQALGFLALITHQIRSGEPIEAVIEKHGLPPDFDYSVFLRELGLDPTSHALLEALGEPEPTASQPQLGSQEVHTPATHRAKKEEKTITPQELLTDEQQQLIELWFGVHKRGLRVARHEKVITKKEVMAFFVLNQPNFSKLQASAALALHRKDKTYGLSEVVKAESDTFNIHQVFLAEDVVRTMIKTIELKYLNFDYLRRNVPPTDNQGGGDSQANTPPSGSDGGDEPAAGKSDDEPHPANQPPFPPEPPTPLAAPAAKKEPEPPAPEPQVETNAGQPAAGNEGLEDINTQLAEAQTLLANHPHHRQIGKIWYITVSALESLIDTQARQALGYTSNHEIITQVLAMNNCPTLNRHNLPLAAHKDLLNEVFMPADYLNEVVSGLVTLQVFGIRAEQPISPARPENGHHDPAEEHFVGLRELIISYHLKDFCEQLLAWMNNDGVIIYKVSTPFLTAATIKHIIPSDGDDATKWIIQQLNQLPAKNRQSVEMRDGSALKYPLSERVDLKDIFISLPVSFEWMYQIWQGFGGLSIPRMHA